MKKWETLKSEVVYETDVLRILREAVKAPGGEEFPHYFVVDSQPGILIVPETTASSVLMIRQYRHGIKEVMIEFPAGTKEDGETLQEAAERELMEEAGVIAKTIVMIGKVASSPALSNQFAQIYLAQGIGWKAKRRTDPKELTEIIELSIDQVIMKVKNGEIWASDTIGAFYIYLQKYQAHKKY